MLIHSVLALEDSATADSPQFHWCVLHIRPYWIYYDFRGFLIVSSLLLNGRGPAAIKSAGVHPGAQAPGARQEGDHERDVYWVPILPPPVLANAGVP